MPFWLVLVCRSPADLHSVMRFFLEGDFGAARVCHAPLRPGT